MIPHSKAFIVLRDKSQEFLNVVVLTCTAVPTLTNQIQASGITGIVPDYFKGAPKAAALQTYAGMYQDTLGQMAVITSFSYFEAYVKSLMTEIIDFHGGAIAFQATAEKRAKAFVALSSPAIIKAKRKLQEPAKPKDISKYQAQSKNLVKENFRFPSELLAPYGVKALIRKAKHNGSKAYEIPELLRDALCFPLSTKDENRINSIRESRNDIAHGNPNILSLGDSLQMGKDLHAIAAKVDQHVVEHFFILEAFA